MIKAGYALEIHSWENDWDFHNAVRLDDLTEEEVQWRVDFLRVLQDRPQSERQRDLSETDYANLVATVPKDYTDFEDGPQENYDDWVNDLICQMLGSPESSEGVRVVEVFEVYYIPFDIPEITHKF